MHCFGTDWERSRTATHAMAQHAQCSQCTQYSQYIQYSQYLLCSSRGTTSSAGPAASRSVRTHYYMLQHAVRIISATCCAHYKCNMPCAFSVQHATHCESDGHGRCTPSCCGACATTATAASAFARSQHAARIVACITSHRIACVAAHRAISAPTAARSFDSCTVGMLRRLPHCRLRARARVPVLRQQAVRSHRQTRTSPVGPHPVTRGSTA